MTPTVLHPDELMEQGVPWAEAWIRAFGPLLKRRTYFRALPDDPLSVAAHVGEGQLFLHWDRYPRLDAKWLSNVPVPCWGELSSISEATCRPPPASVLNAANDLLSAEFARLLAGRKQ